ncbi:MAG TPA: efflux RND transporter periplasmic adaptor subunit [Polyangia bacterium]|nr:efflux RND transporter periplasmic adaptor subunit [Polyangia bacterium]
MRRRALTIACAWAAALGACKKPSPPPPPVPVVRVTTLRTHNIEQVREWLATLDGSTNAEIRPQVSGYIQTVSYHEGTVVAQNTLMFELDHRPFTAVVEKAEGDLQNAMAQWNKAREDVRRYAPLVAEHALSRETLDDARSAAHVGAAQTQAMRGALAVAKLNLEWSFVRSPIDGLAGIATTRVGNLVNANNVLAVVSTLDPIRSSVNISEREYLAVAERLNHVNEPRYANARIIELVLIDGRIHPYRVRRVIVNRQIDPSTGTLLIQALFPNPGNILRPGMFAKVRVHSGAQEDVVLVPERAVQELQGRHMVGVLGADGRVEIRTVKLGRQFDHAYVVESGLQKGDKIIVEGLQNVQPGAKVNAQEIQPPQASAEPVREP